MTTLRWILTEEATDESWNMPINPNKMDALPRAKQLTHAYPSRNNQDRWRTFKSPPTPKTISWSGRIRTQAHYEALDEWGKKPGVVIVTDHLNRTWRVMMIAFRPDRKAGRRTTDYRMGYTMQVQWLERVS